jgi:hypothetical protein
MSKHAELFWNLFVSSGQIVYYLWYKLFSTR